MPVLQRSALVSAEGLVSGCRHRAEASNKGQAGVLVRGQGASMEARDVILTPMLVATVNVSA